MVTISRASAAIALLVLVGCSSGGGSSPTPPAVTPPPVTGPPTDEVQFTELTNRTLDADGDQVGLDAYDLIRAFAGSDVPGPIEAPDMYPINHPAVKHIYEDFDAEVGNHFAFIIHREIDIDRDRVENDDRQRNEIKTYGRSEDVVKGYENETFIYRWKFRINAGMEVSKRFTHLFQLKAVGGNDSHPILTISGAERGGKDGIEVRYSPLQKGTILQRQSWAMVTGEWLEAYCRVTFAESGDLRLIVTRMRDDAVIFDIDERGLDLWRGEDASHFVRPKWGIYRSILELANLRPDEEIVRFANFSVSEVMPAN
ncbi:MAG: hypothetical protein WBN23_16310 [Woeseia sp.]